MTTTPTDEDIRAEAQRMLRERIWQSGWYPGFPKGERERLIEEDVQRHWFLLIHEATERLREGVAEGDAG
jgi:hypothetical protein